MSVGTGAAATRSTASVYGLLMQARRGEPVEELLARMLSSWMLGEGAMPRWLGLGEPRFRWMLARHFPALGGDFAAAQRPMIDVDRCDEIEDLRQLLLQHRSSASEADSLMTDIVVAGCMGADHLWQDLGLWQRADLTRLMQTHFAPLAERNVRDMKWKRFLYKQLCESEGIRTCRAPSCEQCVDYAACFGPEE
jgi:nitrogen fixation protein NifQ